MWRAEEVHIIILYQDVPELLQGGENVDATTTVQPCWLQQPNVLVVMCALHHFIWVPKLVHSPSF